jgi:hypothetical protein
MALHGLWNAVLSAADAWPAGSAAQADVTGCPFRAQGCVASALALCVRLAVAFFIMQLVHARWVVGAAEPPQAESNITAAASTARPAIHRRSRTS